MWQYTVATCRRCAVGSDEGVFVYPISSMAGGIQCPTPLVQLRFRMPSAAHKYYGTRTSPQWWAWERTISGLWQSEPVTIIHTSTLTGEPRRECRINYRVVSPRVEGGQHLRFTKKRRLQPTAQRTGTNPVETNVQSPAMSTEENPLISLHFQHGL